MSAADHAYQRLRSGILAGEFAPGTFIEEEQACRLAEVSRTPVREALNRLAAEGFLDKLPRRGALVRAVTAQELVDLYEARRLLEGHAVRVICAAGLGAPAGLRELHDAMMQTPLADIATSAGLNNQFHQLLVAHCGNGVLIRMAQSLSVMTTRVALSALSIGPERKAVIQAEHLALIEALEQGDAVAAERILAVHLEPVPQLLARMPR